MTISSGGYNLPPQPSIFGQEVSAQHELQNQAGIGKGNVVIVPQSQQDLIPFTLMGDRTTWNYKSESGHPSLLPMGTLRGAGPDFATHDEGWEAQYELLYNQLPEDFKALLESNPSLKATFGAVLELTARGLDWQEGAESLMHSENALNRALANQTFPQAAFSASHSNAQELFELAEGYLEEIGPNDPTYSDMQDFVQQAKELLNGVKP